jgi:protein-ribulosamine 3-kinase
MLQEVPPEVQAAVGAFLQTTTPACALTDFSFVSGGCINSAGKLKTTAGDFFLKWNLADRFPGMLEAERKGLQHLRQAAVIDVPEVFTTGQAGSFQFIMMALIVKAPLAKRYWEMLGERLAQLHRVTAARFGLDHDNYIGSLPQSNAQHLAWIDFFIHERLAPQLRLAYDSRRIDQPWFRKFERIYPTLHSLLPDERPALLHGDLWSGNLMVNEKGEPCLVDPAVYFGHREMEWAMTKLFGGFHETFYASYQQAYPLQPGYDDREDLYTLYPLLVHLNLFGESYKLSLDSILRKYG